MFTLGACSSGGGVPVGGCTVHCKHRRVNRLFFASTHTITKMTSCFILFKAKWQAVQKCMANVGHVNQQTALRRSMQARPEENRKVQNTKHKSLSWFLFFYNKYCFNNKILNCEAILLCLKHLYLAKFNFEHTVIIILKLFYLWLNIGYSKKSSQVWLFWYVWARNCTASHAKSLI